MRYPIYFAAFSGAFYCAFQMQTRIFPKFSYMKYYRDTEGNNGINGNWYQGNHDLLAKFRVFDDVAQASA